MHACMLWPYMLHAMEPCPRADRRLNVATNTPRSIAVRHFLSGQGFLSSIFEFERREKNDTHTHTGQRLRRSPPSEAKVGLGLQQRRRAWRPKVAPPLHGPGGWVSRRGAFVGRAAVLLSHAHAPIPAPHWMFCGNITYAWMHGMRTHACKRRQPSLII